MPMPMPIPVTLPRRAWGDPASPRHALLVHGLGSNGALMWRFGVALADAGWHAVAVDLRGHGTAPRALDYTIAAYAADIAATRPAPPAAWDLVIGHSLGGAAATVAAADDSAWAHRLVLIDPGIHLSEHNREQTRLGQQASFADPSAEAIRAANPTWHEQDVELKLISLRQASPWAVDQTILQNSPWDVRDAAARLSVPAHVIAADPSLDSIFSGEGACEVLQNPVFTMSVVAGAGHSPHRDKPEETMAQLHEALA
ncbi:alpha/beta fold hydrolase [Microbacterium sp.]|uniref:alpha/beta fold hydrolase n=1 Tax=Microbacterium sp. TaxID=51671 RepID=UPI0039E5C2EF